MRFAVIECEDSPKWADGFAAYIKPAFQEDDSEEYVVYQTAIDGSLPSPDEHFDGVVLTGSHYNTRDNPPWQGPLVEYLRRVFVPRGGGASSAGGPVPPRVVGICYGHQLIAHAFGGKVDYNPGSAFVLKSERITPTAALAAQPFATDFVALAEDGATARVRDVGDDAVGPRAPTDAVLAAAKHAGWTAALGLLESHGDCVSQLGPDALCLATSASCAHEVVLTGENFLSLQGHPEFELRSCITERIWPAVVGERKRLSEAEQVAALASFDERRHSRLMLELLRRFLKRRDA